MFAFACKGKRLEMQTVCKWGKFYLCGAGLGPVSYINNFFCVSDIAACGR